MQGSKIRLSTAEAALFCNAEIILTKNSILKKTVALLAEVQEKIAVSEQKNFFPAPKISKGENYRGLPYVVLDYPRISLSEDLLFVRSMFWWGHFFSSTLQLGGRFKEESQIKIESAFEELAAKDFYVGIHTDPWQHHFEPSNYQKISAITKKEFTTALRQQPHIKIAAWWPLSEWDAAANLLIETWRYFTDLIA